VAKPAACDAPPRDTHSREGKGVETGRKEMGGNGLEKEMGGEKKGGG